MYEVTVALTIVVAIVATFAKLISLLDDYISTV